PGPRTSTWRARAAAGRRAAPATAAASASAAAPRWTLRRARQHSEPGGACDVAYLSPRLLVLAPIPRHAVDERLQHPSRRPAEDDGRRGILDRMVRAPRQRHDRQVGAF